MRVYLGLMGLLVALPAMAQQAYEPTVTVLARQAALCEQVASQQITALTNENAALKKQIAELKPADPPKP